MPPLLLQRTETKMLRVSPLLPSSLSAPTLDTEERRWPSEPGTPKRLCLAFRNDPSVAHSTLLETVILETKVIGWCTARGCPE